MTARRRPTALPAPPFAPPDTKGWQGWQFKQAARALVCLAVLQDVGLTGGDLREMAATWMAESGGKRLAENRNSNGTNDLGPAQLNRPDPLIGVDDLRTVWSYAAARTRTLYDTRGFLPWYAHGTQQWLTQFPAVDLACTWLDKADRVRHGYV